jgi:hypothetical protein
MKIPSILRVLVPGLVLATASALAAPALADGATPPPHPIQQRKHVQQHRIGQGVSNGSLTPRETVRLEKQETALNHEERNMRAANGGTLTPAERARLRQQQNRLSRRIYRQKHDAQTQVK